MSDDQDDADNYNKYFSAVVSSIAHYFTSTNSYVPFLFKMLNHEDFSFCVASLEELSDIVVTSTF